MLDLNFHAVATRSDSMEDRDFPRDSALQLEHSASSHSSIVNGEATAAPNDCENDEDSSETATGFIFDIMRKQESDCGIWVGEESASSELVTRPLFPVIGNGRDWDGELRLGLSTLDTSPCPNLSFCDSGSGVKEVKSPPHKQQLVRKSRRGPRSRSSQYRGVTFYRRTGRWESHIWDCGKQVYLGGFDTAHAAARAYDRAAIKFRGTDADINFSTSDYEEDLKQTKNLTKEEFVYILRRHSSRFSRGSSNSQASTLRKRGEWESDDNLGLSLGISKNSEDLSGSCHFNGGGKLNAERTKDHFSLMDGSDTSRVDGPRRQPQTAAMASRQPSIFGSYQGLHQSSSSSSSSLPQHGFANWAWRGKGRGMVSPVPIFTIAASSGFSSFTAHQPF